MKKHIIRTLLACALVTTSLCAAEEQKEVSESGEDFVSTPAQPHLSPSNASGSSDKMTDELKLERLKMSDDFPIKPRYPVQSSEIPEFDPETFLYVPDAHNCLRLLCNTDKGYGGASGGSYEGIRWSEESAGRPKPSVEEVRDIYNQWRADYLSKQYQRERAARYPHLQDQLDMMYHDFDGWRAHIKAIKDQHPKSAS